MSSMALRWSRNLLLPALLGHLLLAQETQPIVDVLCFVADSPDSNARVDIWTIVPYAALTFRPADTVGFRATYSVAIFVRDSAGSLVRQQRFQRSLTAPSYPVAQGAYGDFDRVQAVEHLPPGSYTITVLVGDMASTREYRLVRSYTVPDFRHSTVALSSILIASRVEERAGKPVITPFFAENLAQLREAPFAVVELFSRLGYADHAELVAELLTREHKLLDTLSRQEVTVPAQGRSLLILPLRLPKELPTGMQILRIRLQQPGTILAQSERSVRFLWTFWGRTLEDLDQAIRQLRYVATQEQIDSIQAAPTVAEKRRRFEAFWAALDPTPGTLRNEAFEEYYDRIAQANRLFRSYMEGWLTDRGMVYVIFGPPTRREQFQSNGRQYERWIYPDREFLFVDYTGFEDYRLVTPLPPGAKYRYRGG